MLPLKYSCRKYSFSSGKKWLFSEKVFLFLDSIAKLNSVTARFFHM